MALTIRVVALGSLILVSLGCQPRSDAASKSAPSAQLDQKTESLQGEPAQPVPPPSAAAGPVHEAANVLCLTVCNKAAGLHCGAAEECSNGCKEMLSVPNCQTVMVALLECLAKEPLEHWECDSESHIPAIRDGYCESQQHDVARCAGSPS